MSGFEVVGVVLGTIPVVLAIIEKYQSTRKSKSERDTLRRSLNTEHTTLQNTCEKLLVNIAPAGKIDAFLNDPFGPLWKTQEAHDSVRLRLWKSYDEFEETVRELKDAIDQLGQELGLDDPAQLQSAHLLESGILQRFRGLKFSLPRSRFKKVLETIKTKNDTLQKLLNTSIDQELQVARMSQSRGRYLKLARQSSRSVLNALETSISCPCRSTHSLNLELPLLATYPIPGDTDQDIVNGVSFEVAFTFATVNSHGKATPAPLVGLELQTHTWEQKALQRAQLLPSVIEQSSKRKGSLPRNATLNTYRDENPKKQKQHHPNLGFSTDLGTLTLQHSPQKITNLCKEINIPRGITAPTQSYGLVTSDSPFNKHTFWVGPSNHSYDSSCWAKISLGSLLDCGPHEEYMLDFRRKHILAAKLASSILQLSHSQWLPDTLTSADITFMGESGQRLPEYPFVTKRLRDNKGKTQDITKASLAIRSPLTFSLGIVLLETALGRSIDSLRAGTRPSFLRKAEISLLDDYETAVKHLDQVEREIGPYYAQAVRNCIKCNFMSEKLDLEDDEFRNEVYDKVVALLERNAKALPSVGAQFS
ncbi:hypothetical protein BJ166DRAFT_358957 [Pestalotiopsis sp. NC0098]|nr:hypothetical protein BJ166DRAFT_358957 [Pestalotiopsis sp. NC0098]